MKQLRLPFIIVLVLALGLLGGMVLETHVLSRIGSPVQTVEERPTAQGGKASAPSNPGEFPGEGGFGSIPGFGGGFTSTGSGTSAGPDYDYWVRGSVWVEARFVQIATADLDAVTIGDAAIPADEKLMLTSGERTQLLQALRSKPSYRLLGRVSGTTISGNQMLVQEVDDLSYLVERKAEPPEDSEATEPEDETAEGSSVADQCFPAEPLVSETRETGVRLNVTPFVSADGTVITIVMLPELRMITGWADPGGGRPLAPTFRTWDITTTIYLAPDMSMLMPCSPVPEVGGAPYPGAKPSAEPEQNKTVLILVTARLVELPEEPVESGPPEGPRADESTPGDDEGERLEP